VSGHTAVTEFHPSPNYDKKTVSIIDSRFSFGGDTVIATSESAPLDVGYRSGGTRFPQQFSLDGGDPKRPFLFP